MGEEHAQVVEMVCDVLPFMRTALVDARLIRPAHSLSEGRASDLVAEKVAGMRATLARWQGRYPRDWERRGVRIMEALTRGDKSGKNSRLLIGGVADDPASCFLLNGHRRFAALLFLAATGEIPLEWLRHIPVYFVELHSHREIEKMLRGTRLSLSEVLAEIWVEETTPATALAALRASCSAPKMFLGPVDLRLWLKGPMLTNWAMQRLLALHQANKLVGVADVEATLFAMFLHFDVIPLKDEQDIIQWLSARPHCVEQIFERIRGDWRSILTYFEVLRVWDEASVILLLREGLACAISPAIFLEKSIEYLAEHPQPEMALLFLPHYVSPILHARYAMMDRNPARLPIAEVIRCVSQPWSSGSPDDVASLEDRIRAYLGSLVDPLEKQPGWPMATPNFWHAARDEETVRAIAGDLTSYWGTAAQWHALVTQFPSSGAICHSSTEDIQQYCHNIAEDLAWWESIDREEVRQHTARRIWWVNRILDSTDSAAWMELRDYYQSRGYAEAVEWAEGWRQELVLREDSEPKGQ